MSLNYSFLSNTIQTFEKKYARHNISFYYQNKFNNGKIWEWDMTDMAARNCLPKLIEKEMKQMKWENENGNNMSRVQG